MTSLYRFGFCCLVLLACLAGCGSDGLTEISGTVTFNGQPVEKGNISFLPADGKGPTAAATIAAGKYSVKIAPGQKKVAIEGYKVLGQQHLRPNDPTSPKIDSLEEILPPRFNTQTELTREITGDESTYDFDLK